jgi:hypothetical protein
VSPSPRSPCASRWAALIALGAKRYETRGWTTAHRGLLAIHAGRKAPDAALLAREPFASALRGALARGTLPRGAVVALVRLVEIVPITPEFVATIALAERAFGDYGPGRWAWRLAVVNVLDPPIPASGALGLWQWDAPPDLTRELDRE